MADSRSPEPLSITEPKLAAAALAAGGRLVSVVDDGTRLTFLIGGLPPNFPLLVASDEVQVSARSFISSMEAILGLIAARRQGRRW